MTMYLGTGNANLLPALLTKMTGFLPGDVAPGDVGFANEISNIELKSNSLFISQLR